MRVSWTGFSCPVVGAGDGLLGCVYMLLSVDVADIAVRFDAATDISKEPNLIHKILNRQELIQRVLYSLSVYRQYMIDK